MFNRICSNMLEYMYLNTITLLYSGVLGPSFYSIFMIYISFRIYKYLNSKYHF